MTPRKLIKILVGAILFAPLTLVLLISSIIARYTSRQVDVGIGPEPLINNIYHRQGLVLSGLSAETFVSHTTFITSEFDLDLSASRWPILFRSYFLHLRAIFRYRSLFFYFNGGSLAWTYHRPLEGFLLRLANVRTLVTAYGADVQDLSRSPNNLFKAAVNVDYPGFQRKSRKKIIWQIDYWSRWADHILAGADWVDYLYRWDSLSAAHFSLPITARAYMPPPSREVIKVFHAPNHKTIKGTELFERAIDELRAEGLPVELKVVQGVSNDKIREEIEDCDIVADQLLIGWYGFFAIEAMAAARPVLCYLRPDLIELYFWSGHIENLAELPVANVTLSDLKKKLSELVLNADLRKEIGLRGRRYAQRVHSTQAVGSQLASAVRSILS